MADMSSTSSVGPAPQGASSARSFGPSFAPSFALSLAFGVLVALVAHGLSSFVAELVGAAATTAALFALGVGVAVGALAAGDADGARARRALVGAFVVVGVVALLALRSPPSSLVSSWASLVPGLDADATALWVMRVVVLAPWLLPLGIALGGVGSVLPAASTTGSLLPVVLGALLGVVVDAGLLAPSFGARGPLVVGAALAGALAVWVLATPSPSTVPSAAGLTNGGPTRARALLVLVSAAALAPAGGLLVVAFVLVDATLGRSQPAHATTAAAALAGAVLGAAWTAWSSRRAGAAASSSSPLSSSLAATLVGAAVAITWTALVWDHAPAWFIDGERPSSWAAGEAYRFAVAFVVLAPAAAAFAAVAGVLSRGRAVDGTRLSAPRGLVVAGGVVGAGAGFAWTVHGVLPALGARGVVTIATLALLSLASVVAIVARRERGSDAVGVWASSVALATVAVLLPDWNGNALLAADATRYRPAFTRERSRIVTRVDDDNGVTSVVGRTPTKKQRAAGKKAVVTVLRDGVVVGDDARIARAEARRATLALLHTPARTRAFVAGPGSGAGVAALVAAGFVAVDVAAPSAELWQQVRARLRRAHRGAVEHAGVHMIDDDPRAALARSDARYDLVVLDAPPLTAARAASLVARGLFATARAHLVDDGVLALSFPLGGVASDDVAAVLVTARAVLPSVALFVVDDRAVLVAGARLPDDITAASTTLLARPALARLVGAAFDPQGRRALSSADVDALAAARPALVVDDGGAFAARAPRAAWAAGGARATLVGLGPLLPVDVAGTWRARVDRLAPPRARKAKAAMKTATTTP